MKKIDFKESFTFDQLVSILEGMFVDDLGGVVYYIDRYNKNNTLIALPYGDNCLVLHNIDYYNESPLKPYEQKYVGFFIKGHNAIYDASYQLLYGMEDGIASNYSNSLEYLYKRFSEDMGKHFIDLVAKVDTKDLDSFEFNEPYTFNRDLIELFYNDSPTPNIDYSLPDNIHTSLVEDKSPIIIEYLNKGDDFLRDYAKQVFQENLGIFYWRIKYHDLLCSRLSDIAINSNNQYSDLHKCKAIYKAVEGKKSVAAVLRRGGREVSIKLPVDKLIHALYGNRKDISTYYLSVADRKKVEEFTEDNPYGDENYPSGIYAGDIVELSFRNKVIFKEA